MSHALKITCYFQRVLGLPHILGFKNVLFANQRNQRQFLCLYRWTMHVQLDLLHCLWQNNLLRGEWQNVRWHLASRRWRTRVLPTRLRKSVPNKQTHTHRHRPGAWKWQHAPSSYIRELAIAPPAQAQSSLSRICFMLMRRLCQLAALLSIVLSLSRGRGPCFSRF